MDLESALDYKSRVENRYTQQQQKPLQTHLWPIGNKKKLATKMRRHPPNSRAYCCPLPSLCHTSGYLVKIAREVVCQDFQKTQANSASHSEAESQSGAIINKEHRACF